MRNAHISDDGPDWVMVHRASGRTDFRFYLLLAFGLVFVFAGSVVDPATNCSQDGECAPWLVPVAFWMGVVASLAGIAGLIRNPRRGSRINARTGELQWWNEAHSGDVRSLRLADVAMIRVDTISDTSTLRLFDRQGELMPFAGAEVVPWRLEAWAREIGKLQPHIRIEMAE
ncbi:MAG: hypothetical protein QM773_05890 [Hyphomonadaceae bacterium]